MSVEPLWANKMPPVPAYQININTADAGEIAQLRVFDIGRAEAIINFRQEHGLFTAVEDLLKIEGINRKIIRVNRSVMTVG